MHEYSKLPQMNAKFAPFQPSSLQEIQVFPLFFQYYEMSYGLNVEMHKQVSGKKLSIYLNFFFIQTPQAQT